MLGCTALEKTRCKKHGQAILFFHRNFSEGCAIIVCDFHFPKNICEQYLYPFLRNEYAIIVQSKTSVKFLFSFAALIFFPPQGLSFWHQPLSCRCKGMAAGFGNKRSSLRFSKKSPHRWVVFFRKILLKSTEQLKMSYL